MRKSLAFLLCFVIFAASFTNVKADALWSPPTAPSCRNVFLINTDTNTVVYEKNPNQKIYPASITKLMTAILVMEKFEGKLNTTVTVLQSDIDSLAGTDSSKAGLKGGEQITIEDLLYCLLLPSGNDAAVVLARVTGGDINNFITMMNKEAQVIGARNTHYVNPHGLQDSEQYTTAYDTYLVARKAMNYKELQQIVASNNHTIKQTNKNPSRTLSNTNGLISPNSEYYSKYVQGIKTGTTSEAGACLVSYAQKDGYTYYCVAMGGAESSKNGKKTNTALGDTKALYTWAFSGFKVNSLIDLKEPQAQVKVELAWQKDHILLLPDRQFNALVPSTYDKKDLKIQPVGLPKSVTAPVKKGQKICTADILLKGQKIGTVNLVASEDVALSQPLYILNMIGKFFGSIWFKIVSVVLVIILVSYVVLSYLYNRKKKMLNKRKKKYKMPR